MYSVHNPTEFRKTVLRNLNFLPHQREYHVEYYDPQKPENGHFLFFERKGYYDFGIADYSIEHPFAIQFENPIPCIRFGTVYEGTTKFQLDNQPVSSFSPSSFFVFEKEVKGKQVWKRGQHFHGAEVTIYPRYFEEVIKPLYPKDFYSHFIENTTYHYLPMEMQSVLHRLVKLSEWNQLNSLHLESAMLQFIAILIQDMDSPKESAFTKQLNYGKIRVGNQRFIHLTAHDIKAIQEAHDILSKNIASPPTIEMLSKQLLINTQKLKAGFVHYYHMTIGEFSTTLKMSMASTLLCTTDKSVAEIAQEVGYPYPSNFIKKFQQTYSCTPLKYRQRKNDKR